MHAAPMTCDGTLLSLIDAWPHAPWVWSQLSASVAVPLRFIASRPVLPWCWQSVSRNPTIDIAYVLARPELPWDWAALSMNEGVYAKDIETHIDSPWRWDCLAFNPNITFDFVERHIHREWNWTRLSHMRVPAQALLRHASRPWQWNALSAHAAVSVAFVCAHPELPWDWDMLSCNMHVRVRDMCACDDMPWNLYALAQHPHMTPELLCTIAGPPPAAQRRLATRNVLRMSQWRTTRRRAFARRRTYHEPVELTVLRTPHTFDTSHTWRFFMCNTPHIITHTQNFPDLEWNWSWVSQNPHVSTQYVCMSASPHLTLDVALTAGMYFEWDWRALSSNTFCVHETNTLVYYIARARRTIAHVRVFRDELVVRAWHPDRAVNWCLCVEDIPRARLHTRHVSFEHKI